MEKIISLIIGMLISTILYGQDKNSLVIKLNNGTENAYILSEKPTVLIQNDKMLVTGVVEVTYIRSEISKFYFEEINPDDSRVVGIESISKDNVSFYYVDGENVRITGLKDKTAVFVASPDGKIISNQKSDGTGIVTISLSNQPSGVYIISYGNRSMKIIKK